MGLSFFYLLLYFFITEYSYSREEYSYSSKVGIVLKTVEILINSIDCDVLARVLNWLPKEEGPIRSNNSTLDFRRPISLRDNNLRSS